MKPLPEKNFGPSGIPVVFSNNGTPTVGYLHKQLSDYYFICTDGTHYIKCFLAQTEADIASYTTSLPVGYFTILVGLLDGPIEFIRRIAADRCVVISNSGLQWHNNSPTSTVAGIVTPVLSQSYDILLEDGSDWLLETGYDWVLEVAPPWLLLQNLNGFLTLEDGGRIELEGADA